MPYKKNKCRSCLTKENDMKSLFIAHVFYDETRIIRDVLMYCTSLEILEDDGLPDKICNNCLEELARTLKFRRLCEETDAYLRNKNYNIKNPHLNDYLMGSDIEIISDDEIEFLVCENCGECFEDIDALNEHERQHIENDDKNSDSLLDGKSKKRRATKGTINKCDICNKTFAYPSSLKKHKLKHSNERQYLCSVCGKRFRHINDLNVHEANHTVDKPYKCNICDKSFSLRSTLYLHTQRHNGEQPFICELCGKRFTLQYKMNLHVSRTHNKEKKVECKVCSKKFFHNRLLNQHMRLHTGERPFKCIVCEKCFTAKDILMNHMRIHTGEMPFVCKICDRAFKHRGTLSKHKKLCT